MKSRDASVEREKPDGDCLGNSASFFVYFFTTSIEKLSSYREKKEDCRVVCFSRQ